MYLINKKLKEIRRRGNCIILEYESDADATNTYFEGFKKVMNDIKQVKK